MKILLVTPESLPFAKSGGLGDFIYSYGKALAKLGEDVSVIMPLYHPMRSKYPEIMSGFYDQFDFRMSWRTQGCGVFTLKKDGITFYFCAMDRFDRDQLYGFGDDNERFACFVMAVNTFITRHNEYDVVHCNDWQTAMLPLLLKYNTKSIKTVLTIHNPAYQGWAKREDLGTYFNLSYGYYDSGFVRLGDSFNFLKSGIMSADKINTVSVTHAKELISDHVSFGGMGSIIDWCRHNDFSGIVNGLDIDIWNPMTDKHLAMNYSLDNVEEGKKANKRAIYEKLGMDVNHTGPLFSAITRLSAQKGVERIMDIMPNLAKMNAKMIVIGTGEMEDQFLARALRYPNVYFVKRYDEDLAHLLYAASDFFLMPSYFEPCGTSQMISMRYGTLPIVSNVGGLNDTVFDESKGEIANGFTFYNDDCFGCVNAYFRACNAYSQNRVKAMQVVGMNGDYSWSKSAKEYLALYASINWK
jgi:starch synthase